MNIKISSKFNLFKKDLFPLILIVLMVFSRPMPHLPNFTPLIALSVLSGILFKNFYFSSFVLVSSMFLSDLFLGFHTSMFFIYITLLLIGFIFFKIGKKINYKNLIVFCFLGSLIFFLLTNFIVWLNSSIYTQNIQGLIECYILAIPFFSNTLISTIIYSYAPFILLKFINRNNLMVFS